MQKNVKLLYCVNVENPLSNFRIIPVRTTYFGSIKTNLYIFCSYLNKINFRGKEHRIKNWHIGHEKNFLVSFKIFLGPCTQYYSVYYINFSGGLLYD